MSLNEIIILCLTVYAVIGVLSATGAATTGVRGRMLVFTFLCWPVIAYYGLLMLIERARN